MKYFLVVFLTMFIHTVSAKNYFINAKTGNSSYNGESPEFPFSGYEQLEYISINPGDSVFFARGTAYSGFFTFKHSGTQQKYIVISDYGAGEKPVFSNPDKYWVLQVDGEYVEINNLIVKDTHESGIILKGNHNRIINCEITNTGIGITLKGKYSAVFNNYIHHLHIVKSTEGGDDDYGAMGILIANGSQEIAYNRIDSCIDKSLDYGVDGGAFEFYGNADSVEIHHNYITNCDGIFEFGAGEISEVNFYYNIFLNNGQLGGFHFRGKFFATVKNITVANNTFADIAIEKNQVLWFNGTGQEHNLTLVNNIFYYSGFERFCSNGNFIHTNNLYFSPTGEPLGFSLHHTELFLNPDFIDFNSGDFELGKKSPAINIGKMLGYIEDYNGNPIVNLPDSGAFEHQFP